MPTPVGEPSGRKRARQERRIEERRAFERGQEDALVRLLGQGEQLLAYADCALAGSIFGTSRYNQSALGIARNKEAARRAKHDAASTTLAGSYPDEPWFSYRLVVTTERVLACRTGTQLRGGRRLGLTPIIKEVLWQVERSRMVAASVRVHDAPAREWPGRPGPPHRPVIRLEFDDGTTLDLEPRTQDDQGRQNELLAALNLRR
jgi:hypothetical protein